jgi:sulfur carrier protein ThiS adenylyltransferase
MSSKLFIENLKNKLGKDNLEKVQRTRVGIAGAGGLGSNCAACLVRAGFSKLTIADFDIIDATNLDRQFYFLDQVGTRKVDALKINLSRINPGLELKIFTCKLEKSNIKEIFADCDIIAECFDKAESKSMLIEELGPAGKFVVSVSGLGGIGSSDDIKVHKLKDNLVIIGDLTSDICRKPALSPRVNIAAAKQADVILEQAIKYFKKALDKS